MFQTLLTVAEIGVAGFGIVGIRGAFAHAAIETAKRKATAAVAAYRERNAFVQPLPDEFRGAADALLDTIDTSHNMRALVMQALHELRIPEGKYFSSLDEIQATMQRSAGIFAKVLQRSLEHKAKHLTIKPVKEKIHQAKAKIAQEAAKKTAEKIAASVAAAAAVDPSDAVAATSDIVDSIDADAISATVDSTGEAVSGTLDAVHDTATNAVDAVGDAAHNTVAHTALHFDKLEQKVYDALNESGIYDFAAETIMAVEDEAKHLASGIFGDVVTNHASDAMGGLTDIAAEVTTIPGLWSAVRTLSREVKMLAAEETTFTETLKNGVVPQMIRTGALSFGIMLDGMTGGLSCGAFAIASSFVGGKIANAYIESQNEALVNRMNNIIRDVAVAYREAVAAVGRAVKSFNKEFSEKIETCPNINDEVVLKDYLEDLLKAYQLGLNAAVDKSIVDLNLEKEKLPEKTWLDKILFINRSWEVSKLYEAAQRDIVSYSLGIVHHFSVAVETDAAEAIRFIRSEMVFKNEETLEVLGRMERVTVESAAAYATSLTKWEGECMEFWKQGTEHVEKVTKREKEGYEAYAASMYNELRPMRRKVEANNKRLGLKTAAA